LDILRTHNVNKAWGVIKYVEVFVSESRLVLLARSIWILFKIQEEILLALMGKPSDPFFVVDDYEPPWLPIS
jgi:hypothetical protein